MALDGAFFIEKWHFDRINKTRKGKPQIPARLSARTQMNRRK